MVAGLRKSEPGLHTSEIQHHVDQPDQKSCHTRTSSDLGQRSTDHLKNTDLFLDHTDLAPDSAAEAPFPADRFNADRFNADRASLVDVSVVSCLLPRWRYMTPQAKQTTARVDRSGRDRLGTASEDPSPLAGGRYGCMVVTPMA